MLVLVTGATGYIGGRLVPRLIEAGHDVRVLVRRPERLRDAPWAAEVDVVEGDLTDAAAVDTAMRDIRVVYIRPKKGNETVTAFARVTCTVRATARGTRGRSHPCVVPPTRSTQRPRPLESP